MPPTGNEQIVNTLYSVQLYNMFTMTSSLMPQAGDAHNHTSTIQMAVWVMTATIPTYVSYLVVRKPEPGLF